jgi:hypothetical protein
MRAKYKVYKSGTEPNLCLPNKDGGLLTEAQERQLTDAGFLWDSGYIKPDKRSTGVPWEDRWVQLKEYKRSHHHTNVPRSCPELGNWIHTQRKQYRFFLRGTKSSMTPERISKLRELDFNFEPKSNGANTST